MFTISSADYSCVAPPPSSPLSRPYLAIQLSAAARGRILEWAARGAVLHGRTAAYSSIQVRQGLGRQSHHNLMEIL